MSDRIKQLKTEARRMPKSPAAGGNGPRRISVGTIGVRKVRRSSVKSNTSSNSGSRRRKNPFADLVPSQTKTSTLQPRKLIKKPTTSKGTQQPVIILNKGANSKVLPRSLVISSARNPSARVVAKSPIIASASFDQVPAYMNPFQDLIVKSKEQVVAPIAPNVQEKPVLDSVVTQEASPRSRPSLAHGFVQEDDEKAMESMAMDKIDRFLESLGSTPKHSGSPDIDLSSPVLLASAFPNDDTNKSTTTRQKPPALEIVPIHCETPFLPVRGPPSVASWTTEHEAEHEQNRVDRPDDEASNENTSTSARVVPPLSIRKSPTSANTSQSLPQTPDASMEQEEMFRGVKVSWLLETYHAYMTEKAQTQAVLPDKSSPTSSTSSKGLRPLILPAVCQSPTRVDSPAQSPTAVDKPQSPTRLRRTPTKLNFTFGSPRISPEGALKSPTSVPASPGARVRPVSMPVMKRSNTGLSQQDAVEVARLKMNSVLATEDKFIVPQAMQATTVWRPYLTRNDTVGSQYSALLPPLQHFEPDQTNLASPTRVADSYKSKVNEMPQDDYFARKPEFASNVISPDELRRISERKRLVANNVSFYDPFTASPSKDEKSTSPLAQWTHTRSKTEDASLAASISSRIEKQINPALEVKRVMSGEAQLHQVRTEHIGALSATSSPTLSSFNQQSETLPVRRLSRPSKEYSGESTSEDDDLLPKIRPRFEGFGTSSKAQKVLGMTDAELAGKKPDIKKKKSQTSAIKPVKSTRTEEPALERNKSKGTRRPSFFTQKRSSLSSNKQLVEPFYEDATTSELFSRKSDHPAEFGSATIYPPTKVPSPSATAARSPSYFGNEVADDRQQSMARTSQDRPSVTEQYVKLVDRQTPSVSKARPVPLSRISSRYEETGPKLPSPLSREFGSAGPSSPTKIVNTGATRVSPVKDYFPSTISNTQLKSKSASPSGPPLEKVKLQPALQSESEPHKMFGNYCLSQNGSPVHRKTSYIAAETSPNSDGQRSAGREGFQGNFVGQTLFASQPEQTIAPSERARKASTNFNAGQNGVQVLAPTATRKVSRGLHGRLSVIEQNPLPTSDSSSGKHRGTNTSPSSVRARQEPSIHGLGLGMSPSATNAFDQILGHERNSASPRLNSNRISTLDRINKSADPSSPKASSSTSGHSDSGDRSVDSFTASRTSHPDTNNAVPISYYQPREHKHNADPFRNLDMKTVAKPTNSGLRKKSPTTSHTYAATNRYSDPTGSYKDLRQGKLFSPTESIGSIDRHYIARPSETNDYQKSASGRAVHTKSSKIGVMTPRRLEQPASMMAASEVHERFDIRRALARSDAGDDEGQHYSTATASARYGGTSIDEEADTLGALANTATQAFSKWFG